MKDLVRDIIQTEFLSGLFFIFSLINPPITPFFDPSTPKEIISSNFGSNDIAIWENLDLVTALIAFENRLLPQYDVIPFEDLPFYTPEELIDDGLFQDITDTDNGIITSIISEEEMKHWLEQYTLCYHGFSEGYDPVKCHRKIRSFLILKREDPSL